MENAARGGSVMDLIKELAQETKTLVRDEVQLAKTEISENIKHFAQDAVALIIGGFVAYAGLLILLGGIGVVIGFAFEQLGLNRMVAEFVGLGAVGLLAIVIGAVFVIKGLKAMSKESLAPKRTIETIHHLKGTEPAMAKPATEEKKDDRSSEEIKAGVLATEEKMGQTMAELADRVTLRRFRRRASKEIHMHPYRWGLLAMIGGVVSSFLLQRKWLHGRS